MLPERLREIVNSKAWGLSIAGGGALIGYLAGAVRALLDNASHRAGLRLIYGSSAGALVGAKAAQAVAADKIEPLQQLCHACLQITPASFIGLEGPSWGSLISCVTRLLAAPSTTKRGGGWGLEPIVRREMTAADWRQLVRAAKRKRHPVELGICITRARTLEAAIVGTGGDHPPTVLHRALVASATIPGLFPAVPVFGDPSDCYIDGCVVDLNPSALLASHPIAGELEGVVLVSAAPVRDPFAPLRQPVHSVGQRIGQWVSGEPRLMEPRSIPVVRIGPAARLPLAPLDFDPPRIWPVMEYGFTQLQELLRS